MAQPLFGSRLAKTKAQAKSLLDAWPTAKGLAYVADDFGIQRQAAQEPVISHHQHEAAPRPGCPGEPPRSEERGRQRRQIDQVIPLRRPGARVRANEQAGYQPCHPARRAVSSGRMFISPQPSVQRSMEPPSFSPVA